MLDFFRGYWLAIRRWPVYAGLAALGLATFGWASHSGYRLLGDDNESTEAERSGPGGHGNSLTGHGNFYHK